jgi:nitric oxide reductase subunit B
MQNAIAKYLLNKKYWFFHFVVISLMSVYGLVFMTGEVYESAPPIPDYIDKEGRILISKNKIMRGQEIFHTRGLMNYGSFWGDGAERGPDYTAESLHLMGLAMREYYVNEKALGTVSKGNSIHSWKFNVPKEALLAIGEKVKRELKNNSYERSSNEVTLSEAQEFAFNYIRYYYSQIYTNKDWPDAMFPIGYISKKESIDDLAAFFIWGGWVAVTNRFDKDHSYTQNWPYDSSVGNIATPGVVLISFLSLGLLFLGIIIILYLYGAIKGLAGDPFKINSSKRILTTVDLENDIVRPTQKSTYKFFVYSILLFVVQVSVGVLMSMDFSSPFAGKIHNISPFNLLRSFHTFLQIFWFFLMWIGYTLFFLPRFCEPPKYQQILINTLFGLSVFIGVFGGLGIILGQLGILKGDIAIWFGSQGWEFMEPGRFFFFVLLFAFSLWIFIIYRGVEPWVTLRTFWSLPAWILWGSGIMVFFLYFGMFATTDTNWAVADYWRWMVVHMWVEVTFEVFTTVIVGYILVQLGFVTKVMAEKVIYLGVILFLMTATIGIAHNFYWIAKSTTIIALGSSFSTLQVLPLLLLTFDAYKMKRDGGFAELSYRNGHQKHLMNGVWLFILAVNFWNIFGAGVFGSMLNLPIINYYEHATSFTHAHAHLAMFGVKGNVSLAGMLFVMHHLVDAKYWNARLVKWSFYALNGGITLMVLIDLLPLGIIQVFEVMKSGLWYARSNEFVTGVTFQFFSDLRSIGGTLFISGVFMIAWFVITRLNKLKKLNDNINENDYLRSI